MDTAASGAPAPFAPGSTGAGAGTYAYSWRSSDRVERPMSITEQFEDAAHLGAEVFQVCDDPRLDRLDRAGLADLRRAAAELGLALEVGTRGTRPDHLRRHLGIAEALGARLVRSMWTAGPADPEDRPDRGETERRLREVLPDYARAGVTLALETYEQVPTTALVDVVEAVGDTHLGICLDPANTVAALEDPAEVTARCAPHVKNWHVKDFAFTRAEGWVGFSLTGTPLGEGLLDHDATFTALDPVRRGITRIAEHWLSWQGDAETTTRTEAAWTATTLTRLTANPLEEHQR
ncbi:sugar phosphate isomerase/epimerase [Paenibacillus sp. TRM 82003]|uniref:sugar phosphate isomerase/epimerase family protein n=1 Tax=Kineococcus sp. TRM81007 TaxID=2925831 RepID=UPI001F55B323|nr:sugar phosphate isomerase/epimerase family protein [Kineococcus sp. TRM81007]MCI2237153.1 sugar phosphate isomerase/epimerase [Kineococcus sp. TRM81007]MCI3925274.1 sugar phosphate isomerase/epimerase [Paenibacillus sp. TRM 82003]